MEEVYVFGDQTADCRAFFAKVFPRKDDVLLQAFLERASEAVRVENQTRTHPSKAVPDFNTIQELVDRYYRSEHKDAAIESVLLCISQFCHFIGAFSERTPSYILPNADARLVGLCTGLITATAVSCADSLTALLPLAIESVRIAFRAGAHVGKVAQQLEVDSASKSWSTIVASDEKSAQAALDSFHAEKNISPANRLWISASSATSVTISGPPATKAKCFESSEFFRSKKNAPVPVFAPYHASHLHLESDVQKILRPQTKTIFEAQIQRYPVCSSTTGKAIQGKNGFEIIQEALREIILEPIRWDKVLKYCASGSPSEAKVVAVGVTNLTSSVVSALKAITSKVTVEDQSSWTVLPAAGTKQSKREADIAIVGFSGRFPDAANHELFWDLLVRGLDVHRPVPADRFPVDSHTDPSSKKKNTSHTPFGNFIEHPGLFDARFFNMSPREAAQTDPMQRLIMTTAYEAMEMSGFVADRTPSTKRDRIGTFYGQTSDDWREVNAAQDIDTYFISGGVRAFGPGRLNYFFKWSGPSFSVDTACSSSFAAINVAITSLRAGECDTAFTGGSNVLTNSDIFSGLSRGHFLSRTGSCKTWDNDADGYCRGDGVCTVIMKRYEDAVNDRDPILGVIRGIGTNHSAQAVSITHPCAENQSFLFDKVLKECNVPCNDVNYVEMHGTGTQAGDGIEMESVSSVFAPRQGRRRPDQPLYVGAVKSNIGHGEAVSGVCALIKVLLMLQKSMIPPHTGIKKQINKNFAPDLKERGVNIAFEPTPFRRPAGGKRITFINNFSAAGGNTAMLMTDGPEISTEPTQDPRSTQVITISAKSLAAMKKTLAKFEAYVHANPGVGLADLAYTTSARRNHYTYRASFPVNSVSQLSAALKAIQTETHSPIPLAAPQMAFAYTGQGSQYTGMGKKLYETSRQFRGDIEEFNEIAIRQGLPSIMPLVDGSVEVQNLPPTVVQLGMCCIQMACTRLWATWGVEPSVVIGHSLGEYAALQAAGVLSVADTIYLVGKRASLLEKKCTAGTHAMLAVRCPVAGLQDVIANSNGKIEIACINGVSDTVLSGTMADIDTVAQKLADAGQKCTKLKLPFAFHSSQVDPILEDFEKLAASITYNPPRVPVISPLLSDVVTSGGVFDGLYLSRHCRKTVDFVGGLASAMSTSTISEGSLWLEVGGHPLCASMIKSCLSTSTLPTMRRDDDPWKIISQSMASLYTSGKPVNWEAFHKENDKLRVIHDLPSYGFDEKNYWLQYTGDWLIYKGDYPRPKAIEAAPAPVAAAPVKPRKRLSTAVQGIVSEEVKGQTAIVVAESDFADPKLFPVISGHLVNGSGLCPSTLYADICYTMVDYAYKLLRPGQDAHINIGTMDNPAPLLLKNINEPESQTFRANVSVDLNAGKADFTITSWNGRKDVVHAKCVCVFEDPETWKSEWAKQAYLVQSRIDLLKHKVENGEADKVSRPMAYKLFTALVDYTDAFQGMQSVLFDGPEFEAASTVKFRPGAQDGDFFMNPFYIDSLCHITGFTVNATVNPQDECYISHGWTSLRLAERPQQDKTYYAYVKMQPVAGSKMRAGDVWIFNDKKEVVGVAGAVRFQCIPRKLMDVMMPKPNKGKAAAPAAKPSTSVAAPSPVATRAPAPAPVVAAPAPAPKKVKKEKAPKVKKAPAAPKPAGSLAQKVFNIIATEIDVDHSELVDNVQWADLGVDSLMSLTISGKLREDLDLEVESSLFTDYASVGALRKHFAGMSGPAESAPVDDSSSTDSTDGDSESEEDTVESGVTTPEIVEPPAKADAGRSVAVESVATAPAAGGSDMIETIRQVIAQEMEMELDEIVETTDLSNLGMDSLMALTVLGKLREDHDIDLDPTILADNPTLGHLRKALGFDKPAAAPAKKAPEPPKPAPTPSVSIAPTPAPAPQVMINMPPATSVLLQGNPKTATKNFFLFPDGSGSATSYVSIPAIDSKNLAVYGLNCPFMKDPTSYTCGIEGVSKLYLEEVMRRQPVGPYILGGWSAGGVVAYEVAKQLGELAKTRPDKNLYVEKLILIDSPCPVKLEPLPARLHHFFDEIGLLGTGTGKTPNWLLPHFEYSIKALTAYRPEQAERAGFVTPPTLMLWATDGVCGAPGDPRPPPQADDPKSMKWLLENRTDFGPNGWDRLLDVKKCKMVTIKGNHFTMMKPPVAKAVGQHIREAIQG